MNDQLNELKNCIKKFMSVLKTDNQVYIIYEEGILECLQISSKNIFYSTEGPINIDKLQISECSEIVKLLNLNMERILKEDQENFQQITKKTNRTSQLITCFNNKLETLINEMKKSGEIK